MDDHDLPSTTIETESSDGLRPYRYSLLWLFEVVTIIAVSLALHRDPRFPLTAALILVWSAASGAYLGYRWCTPSDPSSCARWTVGLSALITFLNALAYGIIYGERTKRLGLRFSFSWETDWHYIFLMSVFAALLGMGLGGMFGAGAAYWHERGRGDNHQPT